MKNPFPQQRQQSLPRAEEVHAPLTPHIWADSGPTIVPPALFESFFTDTAVLDKIVVRGVREATNNWSEDAAESVNLNHDSPSGNQSSGGT